MTNAKVYQRLHNDKKVEEHCCRLKHIKYSSLFFLVCFNCMYHTLQQIESNSFHIALDKLMT